MSRYAKLKGKPFSEFDKDQLETWIEDFGEDEVLEAINIAGEQEEIKNLKGLIGKILRTRKSEKSEAESVASATATQSDDSGYASNIDYEEEARLAQLYDDALDMGASYSQAQAYMDSNGTVKLWEGSNGNT